MLSVFLVLAACFCFSFCSPDSEIIDQQYVKSKEYNQFSQQTEEEQQRTIKQNRSLSDRLKGSAHCSSASKRNVPFEISSLSVEQEKLSGRVVSDKKPYSLKLIACTSFKTLNIRWIVLTRPSIYLNKELLMATYNGNKLLDFEMIGLFRDNLTEDISTGIHVREGIDKLRVSADMHRIIRYPIEQKNSIKKLYSIGSEGNIAID